MNYRKIFYILLLLTVAVALLASSALLQDLVSDYIDTLQRFADQNRFLAALLFILFAAMSVLLGPFTSFPLVPPAVAIWGSGLTFFMIYGGWLLGNSLAYVIGHYFGLEIIYKIIGRKKVDEWLDKLRDKLNFVIMLLFRIASPSETGYVFGLIRYNFKKYLLLTAIAELPFVALSVYAGEAFVDTSWATLMSLVALWLVIILIAYVLFVKKTR